jgi:hypothetical protein
MLAESVERADERVLHAPDARPASLDLLDVRGAGSSTAKFGALGAGAHVVELAGGTKLAPGIYVIQLTQGERSEDEGRHHPLSRYCSRGALVLRGRFQE